MAVNHTGARLSWSIGGRLKTTGDVFTDSLAIDPGVPGDHGKLQSLPM